MKELILKSQQLLSTCSLCVIFIRLIEENRRANFNWFLTRVVDIPKFPQCFPIKFPETLIWHNGTPKFIITSSVNNLIKQPAKRLKQYLDDYFKKSIRRSKSTTNPVRSVYVRLTESKKSVQKQSDEYSEVKYKVMLRLKQFVV